MLFYYLRACLIFLAVLSVGVAAEAPWSPLWNGRDLEGWTTWLAKPHPSAVLPDEPRDAKGNFKIRTVAPTGTGTAWGYSGSGYCKGFKYDGPNEAAQTVSFDIEGTGALTATQI
jgi:hypothetical protein